METFEEDWHHGGYPHQLLEALDVLGKLEGPGPPRKLRLYACFCCRRVWELLPAPACRDAVATAERFADGAASREELEGARRAGEVACIGTVGAAGAAASAAAAAALDSAFLAARRCSDHAPRALELARAEDARERGETVPTGPDMFRRLRFARFLHCSFGNPFAPLVIPYPCLAWRDGIITRLAQAAYDTRMLPSGELERGRLLVLADAMEEAGWQDEAVLNHLRDEGRNLPGQGHHLRGCFVIDAILSRG